MNPRRERGFLRWLVAASLLAEGAAAQAPAVPALKVKTVPIPEDEEPPSGTYHGVKELRLSSDQGAPLVLRDRTRNDGEPMPVPIPGPEFSIGREHVLLLGWSSVGGGTLTFHALLLHLTPDAVVLEHNLKLTIARWRGVLVVRRIAPDFMLLGIPEWGSNSLETSLVVGKGWGEKMREMQARRLRFVATELRSTDTYYPAFAPAIVALILRHPEVPTRTIPEVPERVAWLSVTSDGLAWKAGALKAGGRGSSHHRA